MYEALNALGEQGWQINRPMLDIVEHAWAEGGDVGGLPAAAPQLHLQLPADSPRFRLISDTPGQLSLTVLPSMTDALCQHSVDMTICQGCLNLLEASVS